MLTDKEMSSLPKYVRMYIKHLEQKLKQDAIYYQKALDSVEEGTGSISWGFGPQLAHFLPERAVVYFDLDGCTVSARIQDAMIYVQSDNKGLAVLPAYSNCIYIGVLDDS